MRVSSSSWWSEEALVCACFAGGLTPSDRHWHRRCPKRLDIDDDGLTKERREIREAEAPPAGRITEVVPHLPPPPPPPPPTTPATFTGRWRVFWAWERVWPATAETSDAEEWVG